MTQPSDIVVHIGDSATGSAVDFELSIELHGRTDCWEIDHTRGLSGSDPDLSFSRAYPIPERLDSWTVPGLHGGDA